MTKAQVDKLGERLRAEGPTEPNLTLLDEYRRSFGPAYQEVMSAIQEHSHGRLEPTGRFPKTPGSIMAKLIREPSIRLSQIQDIAGCRIVVLRLRDQDDELDAVRASFGGLPIRVIDRRDQPSHGYRAVHIVVSIRERPVEIQVRTALQHQWAELCEKFSDRFGIEVKYGGGPKIVRRALGAAAESVAAMEQYEQAAFRLEALILERPPASRPAMRAEVSHLLSRVDQEREKVMAQVRELMTVVVVS